MRSRQVSLVVASLVVALLALVTVFSVLTVSAGDPDSSSAPGSTYSYTLEDIYNRINEGTAAISTTFTEPSSGPGTGTMHTLNEIYDRMGELARVTKTGQTKCYTNTDNSEVDCPAAGWPGQDGDYQKGMSWPSPRFTGNDTGVITDTLTGLMWTEDAYLAGSMMNWADALSYCNYLSHGGYSDWRLPNVRELQSLIDYGRYNPALPNDHPFDNVQPDYWSSTTIWFVDLIRGVVRNADGSNDRGVWPVRGGL